MGATEIVRGLHMLPLGAVNAYLLELTDRCVLIDTGLPGSAETIVHRIKEAGKDPADIRHIILTHAHPDHIGSLAALKTATRADHESSARLDQRDNVQAFRSAGSGGRSGH